MNRRTLVLAIGGLVIAAFVVGAYLHSRNTQQRVAPAVSTSQSSTLVRAHSPVIGNKDAPVTLVEFFDPACETCRAMYPIVKKLMAEHGDGSGSSCAMPPSTRAPTRPCASWRWRASRASTCRCWRRCWRHSPSGPITTAPTSPRPGPRRRPPASTWLPPATACSRPRHRGARAGHGRHPRHRRAADTHLLRQRQAATLLRHPPATGAGCQRGGHRPQAVSRRQAETQARARACVGCNRRSRIAPIHPHHAARLADYRMADVRPGS